MKLVTFTASALVMSAVLAGPGLAQDISVGTQTRGSAQGTLGTEDTSVGSSGSAGTATGTNTTVDAPGVDLGVGSRARTRGQVDQNSSIGADIGIGSSITID